jgi:hypothetical protein
MPASKPHSRAHSRRSPYGGRVQVRISTAEGPTTLHIDGWAYEAGAPSSWDHPGDPPEIQLTVGWLEDEEHNLTEAELDDLLAAHWAEISEAIESYEAE